MTNDPNVNLSPEFTTSLASAAVTVLEHIACAYREANITCEPLERVRLNEILDSQNERAVIHCV